MCLCNVLVFIVAEVSPGQYLLSLLSYCHSGTHQGEAKTTDQSRSHRIFHNVSQLFMQTFSMIWLPRSSIFHNANMLWKRHLLPLNTFMACIQLSFGISVVVTCFLYIGGKVLLITVFLKVTPSDFEFTCSFVSFLQIYWWSWPESNTTLWFFPFFCRVVLLGYLCWICITSTEK